jgi:hypothetical protein
MILERWLGLWRGKSRKMTRPAAVFWRGLFLSRSGAPFFIFSHLRSQEKPGRSHAGGHAGFGGKRAAAKSGEKSRVFTANPSFSFRWRFGPTVSHALAAPDPTKENYFKDG